MSPQTTYKYLILEKHEENQGRIILSGKKIRVPGGELCDTRVFRTDKISVDRQTGDPTVRNSTRDNRRKLVNGPEQEE